MGRSTLACRRDSPTSNPSTIANQVPAVPAGLLPKNAWSNGPSLEVFTLSDPVRSSTSPTAAKSSASPAPGRVVNSSIDSLSSVTFNPDTESSCNDVLGDSDMVLVQISESIEEEFDEEYEAEHGDGSAELDSIAPGSCVAPLTQAFPAANTVVTSGWDDAPQDAESYWKESQKAPEKELCTAHGVTCKRGICQEYAKQLWAQKRAEAEKEREAQKGKKDNRGNHPVARGALGGSGSPMTTNAQSNPLCCFGAPVKTNWRGVSRVAAVEQREATVRSEATPTSGRGDGDTFDESDADVEDPVTDATSDDDWNVLEVSETGFHLWACKNITNQKKDSPEKAMICAEQIEAASASRE